MEVLFWNINNRPDRPNSGKDVQNDREEKDFNSNTNVTELVSSMHLAVNPALS